MTQVHIPTAAELRSELFAGGEVPPTEVHKALVRINGARQKHVEAFRAVLEGTEGRSLKASEQKAADVHDSEIVRLNQLAEEVRLFQVESDPIVNPGGEDRSGRPWGERRFAIPSRDAFRSYLRSGSDTELRAQGVATGTAGGYFVPEGFRNVVTETLKLVGSVRSVAEVIVTNDGADLPWPTNDDTANTGAILAENTAVTEQDVTLGTKQLGAYAYTSKLVRVSLQLLQDSAFDLEAWLARTLARRIARAQEAHFTTGTGTAQPTGIVTGATVGVTAASTTAITTDELLNLLHSVDPEYRADQANCYWMMNDTTFRDIRKLKDGNQNYLVEPSVQAGAPDALFGYRVVINPNMATPAANAKPVLFGNLRAGYVVRDVTDFQLLRLVERYADFLQQGFLGWQRSDGLVQDAAAYRALSMAAV